MIYKLMMASACADIKNVNNFNPKIRLKCLNVHKNIFKILTKNFCIICKKV
jgi:hypothetical protein